MFCQAGTNDSSFLWHYSVLIHTEWICASKILWLFSESQSAKNKFSPSRYQLFPASSCTTLHLYHLFFIRSDSMRLPIPLLYRKQYFYPALSQTLVLPFSSSSLFKYKAANTSNLIFFRYCLKKSGGRLCSFLVPFIFFIFILLSLYRFNTVSNIITCKIGEFRSFNKI